jgi:clan AA aspartic protease
VSQLTVPIDVGDARGESFQSMEALVDTGAIYVWAPQEVLKRLGVEPQPPREFETADGRIIERDLAVVQLRLDGQTLPTLAILGDEGTEPLLGTVALETFGLSVDPVNERLVPVRGRLKPLATLQACPATRRRDRYGT